MKKGLNNQASEISLSLPKKKILRGADEFSALFRQSTILRGPHLHFRFRIKRRETPVTDSIQNADTPQVSTPASWSIAFVAPKRLGSAVDRNRIKRQMRESFRHHQAHFSAHLPDDSSVTAIFIAQKAPLDSKQVESEISTLIDQFQTRLSSKKSQTLSEPLH